MFVVSIHILKTLRRFRKVFNAELEVDDLSGARVSEILINHARFTTLHSWFSFLSYRCITSVRRGYVKVICR